MKRIPIRAAKEVLDEFKLRQVILFAFDGDGVTHVVTYGKTGTDAVQASDGAKAITKVWGWPESTKEPSRFRAILDENTRLKTQLAGFGMPVTRRTR